MKRQVSLKRSVAVANGQSKRRALCWAHERGCTLSERLVAGAHHARRVARGVQWVPRPVRRQELGGELALAREGRHAQDAKRVARDEADALARAGGRRERDGLLAAVESGRFEPPCGGAAVRLVLLRRWRHDEPHGRVGHTAMGDDEAWVLAALQRDNRRTALAFEAPGRWLCQTKLHRCRSIC
eukprot:6207384-Pleurochrysis_carterae.AAC.2